MRSFYHSSKRVAFAVFSLVSIAMIGCGESQQGGRMTSAPPATADEHDHPSEGPHHGSLIELGNEEYHAELVHDEAAGTVTIYVLDSAAKAAVPIDTKEMQINLSHDGRAEQFKLVASPEAGDPVGRASKFFSDDAELAEDLDHEGAQAQLVVSIAGKQYRGAIEHDHDDEGHDH